MADDWSGSDFDINFRYTVTGLDGYQRQLGQVNQRTGALKKTTSGFDKALHGVATRFVGLQALLGMAQKQFRDMQKFLGDSVKSFRDFNEAMTEVSTILADLDMDLLPMLKAGVEGLSVSFGKSATDLANGLYDILSAAVPVENAMELLYTATKASVAGLTDVSTSVDVMTGVLNAYGYTVEQMVHVSDTMFQSIIRGKFRFEDLASALGYVTPIAAQAGVSFEELSAALATATRHGLHIDMVSRGLALALQNIIKPSEGAVKVAAKYGIELSMASLRAKTLTGFLQDLNEKTAGNAAIMAQIIPNMRSYRVIMVLAGEGIEGLGQDVELMSESLGKADVAFSKMAGTGQRATDIVTQGFEDVKRSIGESLFGVDLFFKKLDMFKGFLVEEFTTTKAYLPAPLNFFENFIAAGVKTAQAMERVDNVIKKYSNSWKESIKESMAIDVEEKKPLAERLKAGEDINLESYKNAADEYIKARDTWTENFVNAQSVIMMGGLDSSRVFQLNAQLEDEYNDVMDLYDAYAYWKSAIDDTEQAIETHSDNIDIYVEKLDTLKEEIGNVGDMYDGTLGKELQVAQADKKLADMTEYINLAIEDEKYQIELASRGFEWYNTELGQSISVVRMYEEAQKKATAAQKEFNFALAENQLQMMKLQLIGMVRRRGLTRGEQQIMKKLEIEQAEMHIAEAEKELEAEKEILDEGVDYKEQSYYDAKRILDSLMRDEKHNVWLLKDTRQEDINDLIASINTKEGAYTELSDIVTTELTGMMDSIALYRDLAVTVYGTDIPDAIQASIDAFMALANLQGNKVSSSTGSGYSRNQITGLTTNEQNVVNSLGGARSPLMQIEPIRNNIMKSLGVPGFRRGIRFVPEDMIASVHKGETITPNGGAAPGDNVKVNINMYNNISSDYDVNKMMATVQRAMDSGITNKKTNRANMRLR